MTKLLHHGLISKEFTPQYVGTDYFCFRHKPCTNQKWRGFSEITAVLIDHQGRVIFNLKCLDCGKIDALKTSPNLWRVPRLKDPLQVFHLSPKLKTRCKQHLWDDF